MVQNVPNNIPGRQYMTSEQFCFWLQGLFELCPDLKNLTEAQVQMIRDHLNYVFQGKPTYIPQASKAVSDMGTYTTTSTYPQGIGSIQTSDLTSLITTVC